jgi:hypothetical protein
MASYWEAAKRPFLNWETLWKGALISMIPIVNLALNGFALEVARHPKRLPSWSPFEKRWKEGFFAFCILVLLLAPALLIGTYIQITHVQYVWLAWIFLIFLILGIYMYPAALIAIAESGAWGHALSSQMFRIAFTGRYFVAWIMANIVAIIAGIIVGLPGALLSFTVVVPFILWVGVIPYMVPVIIMTIIAGAISNKK